jgi:predicted lysophospholipase L1 biosynthesis ABC-type transport system permease subunit
MADELWPNDDPLGKRIRFGDLTSTAPWQTVVGVVGRVRQYALDADGRIAFYMPQTQSPARAMYVVVRTAGDAAGLASAVKKEIRDVDADLPLYHVRTMMEWVEQSLARRRFAMLLLSLFGGVALALATIGVYGVMAYLAAQSTREIGIRIALGATERAVLTLVLGHGAAMALAGAIAGLAAAFVLTRFMRPLLFGVPGTDPVTFAAVAVLLTSVALAASYAPARRAARVDPVRSLRSE